MDFAVPILPGQHKLFPLPYAYDALEPVLSERSVRLHHDILQEQVVNGLNETERKLEEANRSGDFDRIKYLENELACKGSGDILHSLYWAVMAPAGQGGEPGLQTKSQITQCFQNFPNFQQRFAGVADQTDGAGWAILAWQPAWNRLEIQPDQNGALWSGIPVLALDVWEHAYYLDYETRRDEYIRGWWQLINWKEVERRLNLAMHGQMPMTARGF